MEESNQSFGKQVPLSLSSAEHYAEKYYIPHSGVSKAVHAVESALVELSQEPALFRVFYLFGPQGSGKTHFLSLYKKQAEQQGVRIAVVDGISDDDDWIRYFVDSYESTKRQGGLFLVAAERTAQQAFSNPHSGSRLRVATPLEINYPSESELRPLLDSLAERHNFILSEQMGEYLVKRLPGKPLSFDNIFAKISELSLVSGKPVNLGRAREAIEQQED